VAGAVYAFLGVSGIVAGATTGDRVFAVFLFVSGVAFALRGRIAASVELTPEAVVLRGFLRTTTIRLTDISAVTVVRGTTGANGRNRQHLLVERTDGTTMRFRGMNAPGKATGTAVERAAEAINAALPHAGTPDTRSRSTCGTPR
jgi:hypothetical protein